MLRHSNLLKDLTSLSCKYAWIEKGKTVEKLEEDVDRIYVNVTPADVRKINALLKTKEFKGLSDLVRKAINVLYL